MLFNLLFECLAISAPPAEEKTRGRRNVVLEKILRRLCKYRVRNEDKINTNPQCYETKIEFPWKHNEKRGFGTTYPSRGMLRKLQKTANH